MNCEQHKKEVAGISDMKILAEMIVGLHYESLAELYHHLPIAFRESAEKDYAFGNNALGYNQTEIAQRHRDIEHFTNRLWELSKPFMKPGPGCSAT